jgi:hypothetical protein
MGEYDKRINYPEEKEKKHSGYAKHVEKKRKKHSRLKLAWKTSLWVGHMPPTQTELWWRFSFVLELLQFNFTMGGDALSVQDWSPHLSFISKGSQILAFHLKGWFKSKTSIQKYRNEIQKSY